jgi:hypothetical protein
MLTRPKAILSLAIAHFILCAVLCFGQSRSIIAIDIKSEWSGLGEPQKSYLTIKQNNGRFYSGSRRINEENIKAFVDAVENSSPQKWGLPALGVTVQWLKNNASKAIEDYLPKWQYIAMSEKQKALFVDSFSNYDLMEKILTRGLSDETDDEAIDFDSEKSYGIDDFPEVKIQITHTNGDRYLLKSTFDSNFISTWIIRSPQKTCRLHSAAISLGIWRLTPKDFTNRERLSDKARRYELAERLMVDLREKWEVLGAEAELGSAIEPVIRRFTLLKSAVSNSSSIDLSGGSAWNAVVRDANLPPNVEIGFSLPLWRNELRGVDKFLLRIDSVVQLALSPSWFGHFIATHPDAQIQIRFVEDRSLSKKAFEWITKDLANFGKTTVIQKITDAKDQAVFIELNDRQKTPEPRIYVPPSTWSRWVVLPNREMVLWEFQGEKVGNWSVKDFKICDCNGWKCTGAIISDSGEIIP